MFLNKRDIGKNKSAKKKGEPIGDVHDAVVFLFKGERKDDGCKKKTEEKREGIDGH